MNMAFKIKNWEMRARGGGRRGQRVKEASEDVNRENWRTNCTASFASNNLYNILSVLVMTSISTASNLITNIQLIH